MLQSGGTCLPLAQVLQVKSNSLLHCEMKHFR